MPPSPPMPLNPLLGEVMPPMLFRLETLPLPNMLD